MRAAYAAQKGMSRAEFEDCDAGSFTGSSLTEVQSAYTSSRSLTNMVIEQGRRVERRTK